jgi:hypothetical protein
LMEDHCVDGDCQVIQKAHILRQAFTLSAHAV